MSTAPLNPEPRIPSPLPPSPRDFLAYERIIIDGFSTRQAAEELKISQTRVRQLVRKVADWLAENLPAHNETRQAAQLRLAQHIAADRLHRYLSEVEHAWQRTRETKYLSPIIRLLTALSKIPAHPHTLLALVPETLRDNLPASGGRQPTDVEPATHLQESAPLWPVSDRATTPTEGLPAASGPTPPSASHGRSTSPQIQNPQSPIQNPSPPPTRACSPQPNNAQARDAQNSPSQPVTPNHTNTSPNRRPHTTTARQTFLTPAHPAGATGMLPLLSPDPIPKSTITQLQLTPQSINLSTPKHSSRRDRRRLQRLLAKR